MDNPAWIVAALALAWSVINTLYTWYSSTQRITKTEIDDVAKRLAEVEGSIRAMPSTESFHKLELSVIEMKGGMRVIEEQMKPVAVSVRRIEQFLLEPQMKKASGGR